MHSRLTLIGLFILSAAIAMGTPARSPDGDWVDRMAMNAAAASGASADWVDRMAASYAKAGFQISLHADPRASLDWVDRCVRDLGSDYVRALGVQLTDVETYPAR